MVRRFTAATLAAALILVSPGHEAGRAMAAVAAPRASGATAGGLAIGAVAPRRLPTTSLTGRAFTAPVDGPRPMLTSLITGDVARGGPVFTALSADGARSAASVPMMVEALAPSLEAAAAGNAGAAADRGTGAHIEDVITGRQSIGGPYAAVVNAGSPSQNLYGLPAASDSPLATLKPAPEAPKVAAVKVVNSRVAYALHRRLLAMAAALTGAVHSLPAAGAALTDRALAAAADKRVVFSDFDDTLAGYNQVLPAEMVDAVAAVKAAGKELVVVSDRGDEKRGHQLTIFESLESLPVSLRAGMYVAANAGGRVYRYDDAGVPQRVYEAPALEADRKALVSEAAEATKARMKGLGAEQHVPSESNANPSESWNTYGYAMMLKVGSSEAQVRGAAAIMQQELAKRGITTEVNPRFAKDPANPPYINFSIITKAPAVAYIAKALGATAADVVIVGDSMYVPRAADNARPLTDRMSLRLAGRPMPTTGNATDRNMERALPGALTLAVGHNADPRMSNVIVTAVKGPETTRRLLLSVASKRVGATSAKSDALKDVGAALAAVAIVALAAVAGWAMLHAFGEILQLGEQLLRGMSGMGELALLGGAALAVGGLKSVKGDGAKRGPDGNNQEKPMSRVEAVGTFILLAAALAGSLTLLYMLYSSIGNLPSAPVQVPDGWQGPVPDIGDIFGAAGLSGLGMVGMLATGGADRLKAAGRRFMEFIRPAIPFLVWLGLASLTVAIYALMAYAFMHAPAAVPTTPIAPGGWEDLFTLSNGATAVGLGVAGMVGMMGIPRIQANPAPGYAYAYRRAVEVAAGRGVSADQVLFVQAVAVLPVADTRRWNYEFALPRANGNYDLVYVDAEKLFDVPAAYRSSVYANVSFLADGAVARHIEPASLGTLVDPEDALGRVRREAPGFGSRVSVTLRLEQAGEVAPRYRFYDDHGAIAAVDARTGLVSVEKAPTPRADKTGWTPTKVVLLAAAVAAIAYAVLAGHGAAALGAAAVAGVVRQSKARSATKVSDDDVRAAAGYVITYKGRPWSATEFNSVYYPALENLKAKGATKRQIALFETLVADAPIKGGSFNPWSGD